MVELNQKEIQQQVHNALKEDIGKGDVSAALLPENQQVEAQIVSREPMLVCGQAWVNAVFSLLNPAITLDWLVKERQWLATARLLCTISGPSKDILTAERTALNFLQTLSGTATKTYQYVQAIKDTQATLLDTRKTIPGLRMAQKYAVSCGGGTNHRLGLYDAFLIKENHIKACGSISKAIQKAREYDPALFLEIEVENITELVEALKAKPDRILLDNFTEEMLIEAVAINKNYACKLEVSGGVTLDRLLSIAKTGIDYISVGDLTKSLYAIDLSLSITRTDL